MSVILLTNHSENIHNIIKKEDAPPPKISTKPRAPSKLLQTEDKKNKHGHKTFGLAEVPLRKPSEYQKKNSRIVPPRPQIEGPRCLLSHRHPRVPPRPQHTGNASQIECRQNHCYEYVEQAKRLLPHQPKRNYVDTRKGDAHALQPSGLEPHYVLKKTFGKVPNYVRHHQLQAKASKKEIQTEIDQFQHQGHYITEAEREQPQGHYITEAEREALLQGLKHNWAEQQKAYNMLPIIIDTITKKKYKIKLEKQLEQLERDIRTIECHQCIYVTDNDCRML